MFARPKTVKNNLKMSRDASSRAMIDTSLLLLPPYLRPSVKHRLESVQETRRRASQQAVTAVHLRDDESSDGCSSGLERQGLDAGPDETELTNATADHPRNVASHGEIGLQQDAEITHRCRRRD